MDNFHSTMTLFSLYMLIETEHLQSLLELSSIIEVHGKILSLDPLAIQYLQFFGNALGYSLFCELETYCQLAGEIDIFHENIDILLMNSTFILGH